MSCAPASCIILHRQPHGIYSVNPLSRPQRRPWPREKAMEGAPNVSSDLTGQTLGDYRVLRRLGAGGMGQVYLAEQVSLRRRVAPKILHADLAADPKYLQRFRTEAETVAQATHANIVQVYAIGEINGLHFMALEYVEG